MNVKQNHIVTSDLLRMKVHQSTLVLRFLNHDPSFAKLINGSKEEENKIPMIENPKPKF